MCDLMEIWDDEKNIFFHTWAHSGGGGGDSLSGRAPKKIFYFFAASLMKF